MIAKPERQEHNSSAESGTLDPWALVWGQPYIDATRLAAAIDTDLRRNPTPDFRTKLLVRDAARALNAFWGLEKFQHWLYHSDSRSNIEAILREKLGKTGFHNIRRRLVAGIDKSQIAQIFRLLGKQIHERLEVTIAGSIPTVIGGLTARPTDDIDFVDEVPRPIREQHELVREIKNKFGLILGHVQSHYLPRQWHTRRHFLGDFGGIRVYTVDPYDIFVGKLSSKQKKHQEDLRVLATHLDKDTIRERLLTDGQAFLDDPHDRPQIDANWEFIFGDTIIPSGRELLPKAKRPKKRKRPPRGHDDA
jgi:hypothetical protein